jgi:hypothetical protein
MLMALYRPSPLIPEISSKFVTALKAAADLAIDLYWHYFMQNRVTTDWMHHFHIFATCTSLLYCYSEHRTRPDLNAIPNDEVATKIDRCRTLLLRFCPISPQTARYQAAFDILVGLLVPGEMAGNPGRSVEQSIQDHAANTTDTSVGNFHFSASEREPVLDYIMDFDSSLTDGVMRGLWG